MIHQSNTRAILVGIYDKSAHNRPYLRLIYGYILGIPFCEWTPDLAAKNGQLSLVKEFEKIGYYCSFIGADHAAYYGHLHIIKYLRFRKLTGTLATNLDETEITIKVLSNHKNHPYHTHHIITAKTTESGGTKFVSTHCTSTGADLAALGGHLDIIKYLHKHKITGTKWSSVFAARSGNLDIIKFLRWNNLLDIPSCVSVGNYMVCKYLSGKSGNHLYQGRCTVEFYDAIIEKESNLRLIFDDENISQKFSSKKKNFYNLFQY